MCIAGKYSASRFANGMICFNIVHANTKSNMMLRQSICQSPFVTRSSCYNSSNALFSRWPPSSTTLTNTNFSTHDCLLIRLSPLSIPLSFLIAPPRTCSTTIRGHGHSQTFFPRNYSTEGPRTNWWAARPIEVPRSFWPSALTLSRNIVYGHPIFLGQSVHDIIVLYVP